MTDYSAKNPTKKRVVVPAGMTSPRNITAPAASEWPADNMDSRPHEGPSVPANESQDSQENGSEDEPEEAGLSDRMKKIASGTIQRKIWLGQYIEEKSWLVLQGRGCFVNGNIQT